MLRSSSNHGVNGKFDGAHSNQTIIKKLAQSFGIANFFIKTAILGIKRNKNVKGE